MLLRERVCPAAWLLAASAGLLVCAAALVIAPAARPPTRVAIRVSCADALLCEVAESLAIDVWSEERRPGDPLDLVVADDALAGLDASEVPYQVLVPDIDAVARAEHDRLTSPMVARPADWFSEYRNFDEIGGHLRQLVELAPDRVSLQAIGGSVEGRPIWALRIHGGAADATPMLINGTEHAREWISTMVTTCVADRLVRDYDRDPLIRAFVDHTDLWVVPVANPDGYQFSWSTDRYWRKSRRDRHGVDLNRNFSVAFGGPGSSGSKSSQVYRGPYAFSEPESSALRDLAKREHITLNVDFHAYGQLVLYPWGYTGTPTKDRDLFSAVGDRMASSMFATHQVPYALMPAVELYPASGTMMDWMYGEVGAVAYAIELRPKRGTGFVLPPEEIRPTCDEGLAAVLALRASR